MCCGNEQFFYAEQYQSVIFSRIFETLPFWCFVDAQKAILRDSFFINLNVKHVLFPIL